MKNILVIKHGSLGDIVQISGALKDLKNSFTDYKISLLTTPLYQELMSKCPYIDDIILDNRKIKWNPLIFLRLRNKLNNLNFSYVFDFQINIRKTKLNQCIFNQYQQITLKYVNLNVFLFSVLLILVFAYD